ncbi:M23 family metallopeptidase, partial [Candidatus Peregrinibacteria bacterium]|nr:M23 family metallopeptidase [Candidatus Peregrinibacteria bacterium]
YATNRYLRFAHLREGSIPWYLEEGESVEIGEKIGEVGNSGFSSAPHLHLHMQATSDGGAQSIQFYFVEGPLKKGTYVRSELTPNSFVLDHKHNKSLSHEVTYYKGYHSKSYQSKQKWDVSPVTTTNQVVGAHRYFVKVKSYIKKPWYKWKFRLNHTGYFLIFAKFKGTYKRDPKARYSLYSSQDPSVYTVIKMDQQMCNADNWHLLIGTTLKAYKYYYLKLEGQTQGKYISADGLKFVRLW